MTALSKSETDGFAELSAVHETPGRLNHEVAKKSKTRHNRSDAIQTQSQRHASEPQTTAVRYDIFMAAKPHKLYSKWRGPCVCYKSSLM